MVTYTGHHVINMLSKVAVCLSAYIVRSLRVIYNRYREEREREREREMCGKSSDLQCLPVLSLLRGKVLNLGSF